MKAHSFPDHRPQLFGREQDVLHLLERARGKGLTVVRGRPQTGKTWLLEETGRRLTEDRGYLVGYAQNQGGEENLLRRAAADLVQRWLEQASYAEQAKRLGSWLAEDGVIKSGLLVGKLTEAVAKLTSFMPSDLAAKLEDLFKGLADGQQALMTAGIVVSVFDHDQAWQVARMVHGLSGKPIVLILDAWEKSEKLDRDTGSIAAYLDQYSKWPDGHIFLGVRDLDPHNMERAPLVRKTVDTLCQSSALAQVHSIDVMCLDKPEERRMLEAVRAEVPATRAYSDELLLANIQGFPGVLRRWRDVKIPENDLAALEQLAEHAKAYVYAEFSNDSAWSLSYAEARLAMRLVLFPQLDPDAWSVFKPILTEGLEESAFRELRRKEVLQRQAFPTYGHDTRYLAARRWLFNAEYVSQREEAEALLKRLAQVDPNNSNYERIMIALLSVTLICSDVGLSNESYVPYHSLMAYASEVGATHADSDVLANYAAAYAVEVPSFAPLIALGVLNKYWDALKAKNGPLSDALMRALQDVMRVAPGDEILESLASDLVNQGYRAVEEENRERCEIILSTLRKLSNANPDSVLVRERFGRALRNAQIGFRDGWTVAPGDELWNLAAAHGDEPELREQLVAIYNTFQEEALEAGDLDRLQAIYDGLKVWAEDYPEDAIVRVSFAQTVHAQVAAYREGWEAIEDDTRNESELEREFAIWQDARLNELASTARSFPEDPNVIAWAIEGYGFALIKALKAQDHNRMQKLRRDFLELRKALPNQELVGKAADLWEGLIQLSASGVFAPEK